jgi:signal transduction histidine kinase
VPDFLAEAVNVLLTNAAKHAGGSPVDVDIVDVGENVQVRVSDHGPGIPRQWRDRLFEPGFRGGAGDGQGLGLEVARRLMAAQDGWLHLADRDGPGATFVLSLPRQWPPT